MWSPRATRGRPRQCPARGARRRARRRLEEITHPAIRARQQRILSVYEEEAFERIVIWLVRRFNAKERKALSEENLQV